MPVNVLSYSGLAVRLLCNVHYLPNYTKIEDLCVRAMSVYHPRCVFGQIIDTVHVHIQHIADRFLLD